MPRFFSLLRTLPVLLLSIWVCSSANAQIYKYTDALNGAPNVVAANASATNLYLVNSATMATGSTVCANGFTTNGYITGNGTVYPVLSKGVGFNIIPNSGYQLQFDTISIEVRRASGGPTKISIAYSLDAGTTWVQSTTFNQGNTSAACGTMTTSSPSSRCSTG